MGSARPQLSIMMFLQYFVWGAWGVEMGGYMGGTLGFSGVQIGSIYSSTAIAAMISPLFLGYVADRLLATEKLLGLLHLLGAGLLYLAAIVPTLQTVDLPGLGTFDVAGHRFETLWGVMILYALCYMPTLALSNSISFENIADPEKDFPVIRVWGTLGWIAAGLLVGFGLKARAGSLFYEVSPFVINPESSFFVPNNFIYLAAGASALLGLYCFLLPHTPPKGNQAPADGGQRQGILALLADRSFLVFVIASFLICIPLAFYYNLANVFLQETEAPAPTALQTIGQISEVFFMAVMPWFIMRLGVKKMLAIGMLAWVVRYVCFSSLNFPLVVLGLVLHGICYDFFFVASQIYVDSMADVTQRARAQSFIAFVTLGLGMFVGAYVAGFTLDRYPPVEIAVVDRAGAPLLDDAGEPVKKTLPAWDAEGQTGLAKDLNLTAESLLAADQWPEVYFQPDTDFGFRRQDVADALAKLPGAVSGQADREQWQAARRHDWFWIWMWPAAGAAITLLIFLIGFRNPVRKAAR